MPDRPAEHPHLDAAAYPATYLRELSPAWLRHAAYLNGHALEALDAPFRYLELGCGRGLSTLIHGAAYPHAEFHACDVSAACVEQAKRLAAELAIDNVVFHQMAFAELLHLDLRRFQFVVAHGVYSWIDESTRCTLRQLIAATLDDTGVAYVSYNCMPGWAAEAPLCRLMTELAPRGSGDVPEHARAAAGVLQQLSEAHFGYFRDHAQAQAAVEAYQQAPAGYLAHEFLNGAWSAEYSVDVADAMAAVGLELLGSATLPDNHPPLTFGRKAAGLIEALPTERQRRLAADFAANRRFRRDLFCWPAAPSPPPGSAGVAQDNDAPSSALILGCPGDPADLAGPVDVPRGRITFDRRFVAELRRHLSSGPATLTELVAALSRRPEQHPQILRNLLYLTAAGALTPFARKSRSRTMRDEPGFANAAVERMVHRLAGSGGRGWVASEVLGGGVPLDHVEARGILELVEGKRGNGCPSPRAVQRLVHLGILV